ncbi:MAG: hypothetical protein IK115_13725 [Lachnospiraceae bacterium]|nr:hypothetical protein [Lachnospiraceae bacterium]
MSALTVLRGGSTLLLLLGLSPFCCGALLLRKEEAGGEESPGFLEIYIRGLVFVLALFELTAVPFIVALGSFRKLCLVYGIVLALCTVFGAWRMIGMPKKKAAPAEKATLKQRLPWLLIAVLLIIQSVFFVIFQHPDGDDAYYVAQSVISIHTDVMYQKEAYSGYSMPLDARHALGAFPIWIAWLSLCSGVHPTILAHSMLAPFLLALMYGGYALLGKRLFSDKLRYLPYFLLILGLWYTRSTVSLFTAESFAYGRIWQGKALFSNLIVPLAFAWLLDLFKEKKQAALRLFVLAFAAVLCSTAAIFMLGILYGCGVLVLGIYSIKETKKLTPCIKRVFPLCLAVLPLLAGGVIYLLIRR